MISTIKQGQDRVSWMLISYSRIWNSKQALNVPTCANTTSTTFNAGRNVRRKGSSNAKSPAKVKTTDVGYTTIYFKIYVYIYTCIIAFGNRWIGALDNSRTHPRLEPRHPSYSSKPNSITRCTFYYPGIHNCQSTHRDEVNCRQASMRGAMCLKWHVVRHATHARRQRMVLGDGVTMRRVCKWRVAVETTTNIYPGLLTVACWVIACDDYAWYEV